MNLYKSTTIACLPFVAFSLPLGLGNNLAQPIALLILTPLLIYFTSGLLASSLLITITATTSIASLMEYGSGASGYQLLRSGIPFLWFCIILGGYKNGYKELLQKFEQIPNSKKIIHNSILIFSIGQAAQVILFYIGSDLANAASASEDGQRVLLFPTTATIIFFFYALCKRNHFLSLLLGLIILASGSKAMLLASLAMIFLSLIYLRKPKKIIISTAIGTIIASLLLTVNPLAIERITGFISEEKGVDVTREYEIFHARKSFLSSPTTVLVGNGLAAPLTPGVPTPDDRWFENSKFDIENAYWSLIAKLGIVGCVLLAILFTRLPKDIVTATGVLTLMVFGFKTSYQFFTTFDGSLLLLATMLVRSILISKSTVAKK